MSEEEATVDVQESGEVSRRPWWVWLRRIGGPTVRLLIVVAVVEFFLVPQVAGARNDLHKLGGISPLWLSVGVLSQVLSLLAYARLSQITVDAPGVGFRQLLRIDLATLAVSHVVPAGSAVGIGLGYRLLTRSGVPSERAVTGKALQTVGSAVVLNVLLGGALVAALFTHGNNPLYAPIAAVGLALILLAGIAAFVVSRSEGKLTKLVVRIFERIPKVNPDSGRRLVASLAQTVRRLGGDHRFLARVTGWALANWLLEALTLWACVRAFGHSLGPVGLLVAYGLANVAAAIPLTPGGLGIVEGILVPTLVAFNVPNVIALLGVLAFRLMSFWLPIPIGFACYARLEWQLRHQEDVPPHEEPELGRQKKPNFTKDDLAKSELDPPLTAEDAKAEAMAVSEAGSQSGEDGG